ncbi:LysR family transcriptional regulator [Aliikangiella maris]|uniref:LysR family transcriptional regulator n=2 Tax=Aliikangiella maris TaxID=3162458 RepID=A0ABV3MSW6_9GAMM
MRKQHKSNTNYYIYAYILSNEKCQQMTLPYDLALLPALKVLLTEKNISRAADRMLLSQPAMSRIFSRLKSDFNDPLMVRAGNRYQLTPKAQIILQQLNQLLPQLENLSKSEELVLTEIAQNVTISGTDMDIIFISKRINHIRQRAPRLKLNFRHSSRHIIDDLIAAQIDLALTALDDERAGVYRKPISQEGFVVIAGPQNPLCASTMNLDNYLAQQHGIFSFAEPMRGKIDIALDQLGYQRDISVSIPTFLQIPPFLSDPNLLFSVPLSFAMYLSDHFPIKILPLPFKSQKLTIYLYWHERQHNEPLHQWIRNNLLDPTLDEIQPAM